MWILALYLQVHKKSGDDDDVIKGQNWVVNLRKLSRNNLKLDLVQVNAYANFPLIHS